MDCFFGDLHFLSMYEATRRAADEMRELFHFSFFVDS